jgi:dihydrofolate synthase/folylpolyglutamate synthase
MTYAAAIDQLNALAPELYSTPGRPRRKFSLAEIGILLDALGNPHRKFPSVLIAGTNGKGSTAATLASILAASGLRTGLYTSPHLERANERIRIGAPAGASQEISDSDFARHYFAVHDTAEALIASGKLGQAPSFFEILTAMAFLHFAGHDLDIAVLEVGMGGRLDATNIVDPLLSVITDISLDHTEWLGPTIAAITREKAGILRANGTLVTLPQHPQANQVIGEVAAELNVRGVSATPYMPSIGTPANQPYPIELLGAAIRVASPLSGAHQHRNIALAIAAAVELAHTHHFPITASSIEQGIRATCWPARLERIRARGLDWILDVAHNPAGAWALRAGLSSLFPNESARPSTLVFSCLRDKPLAEMAQILFPIFDRVIFAPIHSLRATPIDDLLRAASSTGTPAHAAASVEEALALAQHTVTSDTAAGKVAKDFGELKGTGFSPYMCAPAKNGALAPAGIIVVSGSVYLVGEARTLLTAGSK